MLDKNTERVQDNETSPVIFTSRTAGRLPEGEKGLVNYSQEIRKINI